MRSVFVERPEARDVRRRAGGWQGWLWMWLPVGCALIVIALESTRTMSAQNTSSWLRPVFERIFGHINDTAWQIGHHIARKSGHFCGYGLVCVTFLRAYLLRFAQAVRMTVRRWAWQSQGLAVLSTFVVASADELHQAFLPNRTGQASDVAIDTMGGVTITAVVWLCGMWVRRRARRLEMVTA